LEEVRSWSWGSVFEVEGNIVGDEELINQIDFDLWWLQIATRV
jgi:hypothetical protein